MTSSDLTPREREVASMLDQSNATIASRLGLTTGTVKQYISHIIERTGLPNRTAIALAWRDRTA